MARPAHLRTVFIVEDDAALRDALGLLLGLRGYPTAMFACAEDFLRARQPDWRGVVVADLRMPGLSGLELQQALQQQAAPLPLIVITAHGDIAAARQAFKAGATDFLEKPFDDEVLVTAIERALDALDAQHPGGGAPAGIAALSARERQVLDLVVDGLDNRRIGEALGISPRTVEVHKARIMAKLGARSLADLIRLHARLGRAP